MTCQTTPDRVALKQEGLPANDQVYCRACGTGIHGSARACPLCGAQQQLAEAASPKTHSSLWLAIASLVLGVLCLLALLVEEDWSIDSYAGLVSLASPSVVMGVASLLRGASGREMAIAGITLSSIALMAALIVGFGRLGG